MPGKHHLTTYQAAELIDLLRASARANGVSLSAEVRGRLLASYKHEGDQQRAATDASTQVLSFPDGRTAVVTLTCQSLPMDVDTDQTPVDDEAKFLSLDAIVGADKSGSTQALRENRELKFDEYLPRRELQPPLTETTDRK